MTHAVAELRKLSQLICAALVAALGARAMIASLDEVARVRTAMEPVEPEKPALLELADELAGDAVASPVAAPPAELAPDTGDSLRLTLSVTLGPPRSEVYVNGRRVGESPYLGDYACKRGEALRVEIVPEQESLIVRRAVCTGVTLFIRE
jgi:hypothetical protein